MSSVTQQLQQSLTNQISASENFLRLLLQERETIAQNLIEKLPELTQNKLKLIEVLAQTEIEILSCFKQVLGENSNEQPETTIQKLDPDNRYNLLSLLQKARDLAAECKNENLINSQIVDGCQNQVEQTLDVLLKRDRHSVYGASGKTIKQSGSSLGEA